MASPALSRPRAPEEAWARSWLTGTGGRPRFSRSRFRARARSGAVSATVPSRSNSTAWTSGASAANGMHEIIDAGIVTQTISGGERVVRHAFEFPDFQSRVAAMLGELGRFDEFRIIV